MTTQVSDRITFKGFEYILPDFPLEEYWKIKGMHSPFPPLHTANWRGYQAAWVVRDHRLYLLSVLYFDDAQEKWLEALPKLFPGCKGAVWAHWFSGRIRFGLRPRSGRWPRRWEVHFDIENKLTFRDGKVTDEDLFYKVADCRV